MSRGLCGPDFREHAVSYAEEYEKEGMPSELGYWTPNSEDLLSLVSPLLRLPDVPDWIFPILFNRCGTYRLDIKLQSRIPKCVRTSWPIRSIYMGDFQFLKHIHAHITTKDATNDEQFAFDGAFVASIWMGRLDILQWLLEAAKLPVEPTLLEEAILAQAFDIALWLLENHPAACTRFNRLDQNQVHPGGVSVGVCDDTLTQATMDWFQTDQKAQSIVDCGVMAYYAVMQGNIEWFDVFYKLQPSVVMTRAGLLDVAVTHGPVSMLGHLLEIGYSHRVTNDLDIKPAAASQPNSRRRRRSEGISEKWMQEWIPDRITRFLIRHHYFDDFEEPAEWSKAHHFFFASSIRLLVRLYRVHPEVFCE